MPYEPKLHVELARIAEHLQEHDVTIREHGFLLQSPGQNPKVSHLAIAKAFAAKGAKEEAEKHAQKVLELDPEDDDAKDLLKRLGSK